jgi:hypothetical protein
LYNYWKKDGKKWATLLQGLGGMLKWAKCFYYLVSWIWASKGNPVPESIQSQQEKIALQLGGTTDILIQRDVKKSHKALGTFKCLVGNNCDHIEFLTEKRMATTNKITTCQLNRRQAKMAYNSCYIPALLYNLSAVRLTQQQTDSIQLKATSEFIQKNRFQ